MESTGVRDRIQVSPTTADLLTAAGKGHWIKPREDTVGKCLGKTLSHVSSDDPLTNSLH